MLHGAKRLEWRKEALKGPPPEHAASNTSRHDTQTVTQSERPRKSPPEKAKQRWSGSSSSRRNARPAKPAKSAKPAARQRANAPQLKDEAYIRSTMNMPTPKEYPDAPKDVFKHPKSAFYNIAGGFSECRSELTALAAGAYQCTAYYKSATHNQVVIGEGRTKVRRSNS